MIFIYLFTHLNDKENVMNELSQTKIFSAVKGLIFINFLSTEKRHAIFFLSFSTDYDMDRDGNMENDWCLPYTFRN